MVIFLDKLYIFGSIFKLCYIQKNIIMNSVIKGFVCTATETRRQNIQANFFFLFLVVQQDGKPYFALFFFPHKFFVLLNPAKKASIFSVNQVRLLLQEQKNPNEEEMDWS